MFDLQLLGRSHAGSNLAIPFCDAILLADKLWNKGNQLVQIRIYQRRLYDLVITLLLSIALVPMQAQIAVHASVVELPCAVLGQ
jgi:hypothetical protein